jgi:hypothetical protein
MEDAVNAAENFIQSRPAGDFVFENFGSVCILTAVSDQAKAWVEDHLPEDRMTWGRNGSVIEPRYVDDILSGIVADGLTVN